MARLKPEFTAIANHGMAIAFHNEKARQAQERDEERRFIRLASAIETEEELAGVLAQFEDPKMRAGVEARLRPFTKIPVPILE